ncbi:uncharacterized protein MELLADRAFT_116697 [Melampsora larici-populina 98AG31]|uniref:DNA replication regulator SLD2 n=1 Tax=Melampsora larici-populina (strain 98AG31 / pathotype 3-4-7) TaxID=747676 RepID=F4RP70_MELLP|nr:uncharacterized protein MELLADRAFT_116697 [Melampsora larici-populina 98AG31]EGG05902.1 hypothetical protein MELLADRAFT_116697 [Melampsora larici-populina 98AG31]
MSTNQELTVIKSKLKTWEREFKKSNGRDPTKSDIKSNPEIAKLYSTYNTTKSNDRKTSHSSKPSTSSTHISNSESTSCMQTTPQKQRLEDKSNTKKSHQINNSLYQNPNSPIKLRQLLLSNSPRKKSNGKMTNTKGLKNNQSNTTSTPKSNPFESNSGGGKGSPDLFADLLLQAKDTPRTKARKYLIGVGSPLKPKPNLNRSESTTTINGGGGGLSTFLKSRTDESQSKVNQVQEKVEIEDQDENSDDILGPSPFKPKPSGQLPFRCLFDDQEASTQSTQSPIKPNPINKLNIKSSIPFIPNNSQNSIGTLSEFPGCGQLDLQKQRQQADKNRIPVGAKRKRMKPGEEDASFYEDINDPDLDGLSTIKKVIRNTTKRTKVDRTNSNVIKRKTNQSQLNVSTRLPVNKTKDSRDCDGSDSEEEGLAKMPDLPFGAQSQTSVITELETFTFAPTDPNSKPVPTIPQQINSKLKVNKSKPDWKGKGKATTPPLLIEEETKQIKVTGTQKVMVRPYKPVNEIQMKKLRMTNIFQEPEPNISESLGPLNDEAVSSEEEENLEEINDDGLMKEEEEGDIIVSEELLNLLNLDAVSGNDRKILKREKVREEKVRRVLEGSNSKPIKEIKTDPVKTKITKPIKTSLKTKLQSVGGSTNSKHQRESSVDLGTEEYGLSEDEMEDEDEDDDWEEDPEGWKELDGDDGLYNDDYEL